MEGQRKNISNDLKPRKGSHFPLARWTGIALLCLFVIIIVKMTIHRTPEDHQQYLSLMAEADPSLGENNTLVPYSATQNREGIRKDYYFSQGQQRLHLRMLSNNATLMMHHENSESSLIENMQGVKCHVQEELYYLLPDSREAVKSAEGQLILKQADKSVEISPEEAATAMPMQRIRYFEAENASYHYKTDKFYAK